MNKDWSSRSLFLQKSTGFSRSLGIRSFEGIIKYTESLCVQVEANTLSKFAIAAQL